MKTQILNVFLILFFAMGVECKSKHKEIPAPSTSKFGNFTDQLADAFGMVPAHKMHPDVREVFQEFTLKSLDINHTSLI
jgi:hypothetical protein